MLANVLLVAEDDRLKLVATNLEIAITAWIPAEVQEEGQITLRADLLTDFVASLPSGEVSFQVDRAKFSMLVECARSKAHIKGVPAEDFPTLPSLGDANPLAQIESSLFREMVAQVAFAAATDDSRPVLAGVLAEFQGDNLTMAAADGFRLSVRQAKLDTAAPDDVSIIIPARALQELARIIGDDVESVELAVTPNQSQLIARAGSVEFLSRLIDGNFPDVRRIIPQQYGTRVVLDREAFLAAARRAKLFAQANNDVVRIQIDPGDGDLELGFAKVSAQAAETGDNEDFLEARVEGPPNQIAFNGRYLADVLSVVKVGEIALEMTGANAGGVFRPVGEDDFTHVIMPMVVGS